MSSRAFLSIPWLLAGALGLGASQCLALDATRPLAEFSLSTWTRAEGLPHGFVIDIEQSSEGYIWVATWRGAARFNGREFEIFDQRTLPWNEDGSVWKISAASDGSLLLGSQRFGLSRQRGGLWSHEWQPEPGTALLAVIEDSEGRTWIGTRDGALRLDVGATRRFSVADGMPDATSLSMAAAADGVVWIGTADGVARIDGESVQSFGTAEGLPPGEIGMMLVSSDGTVRVGSKRGVLRLDRDRFVAELPELPADEVSALLLDRAGALWIGTVGHGVFRATGRGVEQLSTAQGLPSAHVNSLLEDVQGNLWIGTHGGLSQLREARFAIYSSSDGLEDDFVRSIVEDQSEAIWIASNGGVSRIRDGRVERLVESNADAGLSSLSLLARRNGEVWVGTYRDGVRVFGADGMRALRRAEGLAGEEVRSMLEADDGSIWLGMASGLTRLSGNTTRSWERVGDEPKQLYVRALLQHSSGRIFLGTPDGLAWTDGEVIARLPLPQGHAVNVFGLHECAHGHLWLLGSGGLWRLRGDTWDRLGADHELGRHTIFGMQSDPQGNDWLSTAQGLVSVRHEDLERAVDEPTAPLAQVRYADGPGSEGFSFNGGSTPSSLRTRDGRIWLASGQGAVVFDPAALEIPVASPPTVIERILVDGAEREASAAVELAPGTRRIEFGYAGLSFLALESIRYRHRLIGFDETWADAGDATSVSYTNLPPGDYQFEVEAVIAGAMDQARTARHAFRIRPHLHEMIEFRLAIGILLVLLGVIWFRRRTSALRHRAADLQAIVDERTQELTLRGDRLEQADREKAILIAQLEAQSALLARHAQEDGLTGLANRRELDRSLEAALQRASRSGQPLSLALVDIDHFKRINDHFGHGVGDDVLRAVAQVVRGLLRPPMQAGRYGGEEFALILPDLQASEAEALCESLRSQIELAGAGMDHADLRVTVSIGIADVAGLKAKAAYAAADKCLYQAKNAGRNRVVR